MRSDLRLMAVCQYWRLVYVCDEKAGQRRWCIYDSYVHVSDFMIPLIDAGSLLNESRHTNN